MKLSDSKLQEKYSKHERPANVEALQTTQVNKIIWDNPVPNQIKRYQT